MRKINNHRLRNRLLFWNSSSLYRCTKYERPLFEILKSCPSWLYFYLTVIFSYLFFYKREKQHNTNAIVLNFDVKEKKRIRWWRLRADWIQIAPLMLHVGALRDYPNICFNLQTQPGVSRRSHLNANKQVRSRLRSLFSISMYLSFFM